MTQTSAGPFLAAALFALCAVVVVAARPLLPVDETRYLAVAWEMRVHGDWLVPRLDGALYGHKPPLLFWLVNLAWSVAGVGDWPARLVAPLFAALAVWLTGRLARELWPEDRRGGLAALILATTGAFLLYGTATTFDAILTAGVVLCVLALWRLAKEGRRRWAVLLGVGLALGAYGKGPVVLVHVAPAALLMPLWRPPGSGLGYGRHLRLLALALGVALALVAVWLLPALALGGPAYRTEILWRQSVGRLASAFDHGRPVWWYLPGLPLLLWPWGWRPGAWAALAPRRVWGDAGSRLVAVWAATAFAAFSLISGKQTHYLLPELAALALLLSAAAPERSRAWRLAALAPAALVLSAAALLALRLTPLAERPGFALPPVVVLLAAVVLAALAWGLRRLPAGPVAWALVAPLSLLALLVAAAPILARGYDAAPLARLLARHETAGLAIAGAEYHGQFTWAGRLTAPVTELSDDAAIAAWAAAHPGGRILAEDGAPTGGLAAVAEAPFRGRLHRVLAAPGGPAETAP